jgi:AcrR family transcriptional regulator
METKSRQAERSGATRAELVRTARELFAERGYASVGTEEIVQRAKVTRGALYHHFADKRALFRAVHEQMEAEIVAAIAGQMAGIEDPIELLVTGTRAFLDACMDPAHARVNLLEAPSVLGWEEWREIDMRHGLGLVIAGLQGGMDAGALRVQPVRPLAHLLLAAMGEAAMMIANSDDPQTARDEMEVSLLALLEGLRVSG